VIGLPELMILTLPALLAAGLVVLGFRKLGIVAPLRTAVCVMTVLASTMWLSFIGSFTVAWTTSALLPMIAVLLLATLIPPVILLGAITVSRKIARG
jgi:hypothetical protein